MPAKTFIPLSDALPYWPADLLDEPAFLKRVGVSEFDIKVQNDVTTMSGRVLFLQDLAVKLPWLAGTSSWSP